MTVAPPREVLLVRCRFTRSRPLPARDAEAEKSFMSVSEPSDRCAEMVITTMFGSVCE